MKPKAVVHLGNITLNADTYSDKDLNDYYNGLHRKIREVFDDCSSDDLIAGVVTPYGADARIKYYSPVLDKSGNNVVKHSRFIIEEIEDTGELPIHRTHLDWKIMILENLLEGLNSPTNKHSSIKNVNDLINNIKNKDIRDNKLNNPVVVDNTKLQDKPVKLVSTPLPSGRTLNLTSNTTGVTTLIVTNSPNTAAPLVLSQKQWCEDGHLWTQVPSSDLCSKELENQVVIPNCTFCQDTRSTLKRFITSIKSLFGKK